MCVFVRVRVGERIGSSFTKSFAPLQMQAITRLTHKGAALNATKTIAKSKLKGGALIVVG